MRWILVTTLLTTFSTQISGKVIVKRSLVDSFSSNPIFQRVFNGQNPDASLASKFLQNPRASFSPASNVVVYYNSDEITSDSDEREDSQDASNSIEIEDNGEESTTVTAQESSSSSTTEKLYSSEITTRRNPNFSADIGGVSTSTSTSSEEENTVTLFPQSTIVTSEVPSFITSTQLISTPPENTIPFVDNNNSLPSSTTLLPTTTSESPDRSTFSPTVTVVSTPTSNSSSTSAPESGSQAQPLTSQTLDYQIASTTGRPHWHQPHQNPFTSYSNVYASTITSKPYLHESGNSSTTNSTKIIPGHLYKSPVIPGFFPSNDSEVVHRPQATLPVYHQKPMNQTQDPVNITEVDSYRKIDHSPNFNSSNIPLEQLYQSAFIASFFQNQHNNSNTQRPPVYLQTSVNRTQDPSHQRPTNITKVTNPYNIAFQSLLQQGNRTQRPRRPDPITEFMTNFFGLIGRSKRSVDSNGRNLLRISKESVASKFIAPKYFPKFADYELPERRHTLPKYVLGKNRKMDRASLRDLFNKDFSRGARNEKEIPRFVGSFEQIL